MGSTRWLLHQRILVALMCQQRAEQAQCPNTESETGVTSWWLHDRRRFAGELNLPACLQKGKNPFKWLSLVCGLNIWWMTIHCPSACRQGVSFAHMMLEKWLMDKILCQGRVFSAYIGNWKPTGASPKSSGTAATAQALAGCILIWEIWVKMLLELCWDNCF